MFSFLTSSTYKEFLSSCSQGAYIDVVPSNFEYHPGMATVCCIFIVNIETGEAKLANIRHPDLEKIPLVDVVKELSELSTVFVADKKYTSYFFSLPNMVDLYLLANMHSMNFPDPVSSPSIDWYYSREIPKKNVNCFIPLLVLKDYCFLKYKSLTDFISLPIPFGFKFYNEEVVNVFKSIESQGIGIKVDDFKEAFSLKDPSFSIHNNKIYTYYNLYNFTSRPSNSFNGVNFVAIPKTSESRSCIVPTNTSFVEFDFDSYHLRLLANLIGYKFPSSSAHEYLGKKVFEKDDLTQEEYEFIKQVNFQSLYGSILPDVKHIDFYESVETYVNKLWKMYSKDGFIISPYTGKHIAKDFKDINKKKLINYFVQNLETERNVQVLKDALIYLRDKSSKIVLYTYDSVLLDFDKEDGQETISNLESILSSSNSFPVSTTFKTTLFS